MTDQNEIQKRDELIQDLFMRLTEFSGEIDDFNHDEHETDIKKWRSWRGEDGLGHWEWWAREKCGESYDLGCGKTRESVIECARQVVGDSPDIEIIEARCWNDLANGEEEIVPFAETRNHEIVRGQAND